MNFVALGFTLLVVAPTSISEENASAVLAVVRSEVTRIQSDAELKDLLREVDQPSALSEPAAKSILDRLSLPMYLSPQEDLARYRESLLSVLSDDLDKLAEGRRGDAAIRVRKIGEEAPHPVFLPFLRLLARSPLEPIDVRNEAIVAISRIPHPDVIPDLITLMDDSDVAPQAAVQASQLTGVRPPESTDLRVWRAQIEAWWAANQTTFRYDAKVRQHMTRVY